MNHKNETKVCGRVHATINTTYKDKDTVTVVVEVDQGRFTSMAPVQFFDRKAELCKGLQKGDEVEIDADISGREKDGRWFVNVNGYRLVRMSAARTVESQAAPAPGTSEAGDDEIPF